MDMPAVFIVLAHKDERSGRWTATSDDIPGLVAEAATFDELDVCVQELAPTLLRLNEEDDLLNIPVMIQASTSFTMRAQ